MTFQELLKAQKLTDEQIAAITAAMKENKIYTAGEENLDIRFGKLKGEHDTLAGQYSDAQKVIADLKKGNPDNEALQSKITSYEQEKTKLESELAQTKLDAAIKVGLLGAKATDVDYLAYKLKEQNKDLKLDDDGNVKGIDDIVKDLKTSFPHQFEAATTERQIQEHKLDGTNAGGNDETMTKGELLKKPYNERVQFAEENPDEYKEIMGK